MSYLATGYYDNTQKCIAKGNEASQPLDDQVIFVSVNWRPSGYYAPAQIDAILKQLWEVKDRAYAELERPTYQGAAVIFEAKSQLNRLAGEMNGYLAKVIEAKRSNITQIDAPGLRGLVIRVLQASRDGIVAATTISCLETWWLGAFKAFQAVFDAAVDVVLSIPGIVLDAAKAVLAIPDAISSVMKWSLIAGAALLAWWAFKPTATRGANER